MKEGLLLVKRTFLDHYIVDFNPIAISWGTIVIPWYWLVYFGGYLWLLWLLPKLAVKLGTKLSRRAVNDFVVMGFLALILCARLTYILIYNFSYYAADWERSYRLWEGGMSFHGALLGVLLVAWWLSRRYKVSLTAFTDLGATVIAPILFFGRLANFINGELAGRVSTLPWAMIFPRYGDGLPRHPSQLYEAFLEGIVIALIMWSTRAKIAKAGYQSGQFLLLYGGARFLVEFVRAPDIQLGLYFEVLTMGQILCLLMMVAGFYLVKRSGVRKEEL